MVTTQSSKLNTLCRSLRDHGATRTDRDRHEKKEGFLLSDYPYLGYNYRMTDLQAALGFAQIKKVDWILEQRREAASFYTEKLSDSPWLKPPIIPKFYEHGFQAYVCMYEPDISTSEDIEKYHNQRNELMRRLEGAGISTRPGTHAAYLQTYYRDKYSYSPDDFFNAYRAQQLSLALPLYPQITRKEQNQVVEQLMRFHEELS